MQVSDSPVVILGFGAPGQMLANMLTLEGAGRTPFVAFDLDPTRVRMGRAAGFSVVFGDGSRPNVLKAAGVSNPLAVAVCFSSRDRAVNSVECLRQMYPRVPIYACAQDFRWVWV